MKLTGAESVKQLIPSSATTVHFPHPPARLPMELRRGAGLAIGFATGLRGPSPWWTRQGRIPNASYERYGRRPAWAAARASAPGTRGRGGLRGPDAVRLGRPDGVGVRHRSLRLQPLRTGLPEGFEAALEGPLEVVLEGSLRLALGEPVDEPVEEPFQEPLAGLLALLGGRSAARMS